MKWLNRPWLYLSCHLCIVKIALAFSSLFACGVASNLMMIGLNTDSKDYSITGFRYVVMRFTQWWAG